MIEIKDFLNDIKERIATEENYYIAMLIITIGRMIKHDQINGK